MAIRRLLLSAALALLILAPASTACAEDFWFAAITDTHIRDEAAAEIVREAVAMINADERIAMSLWLGDITDTSTEAEFVISQDVLEGCERPWHPARGNHDLKDGLYEQYFGALNRRVEHEGWVFLLFDSNGPRDTLVSDETLAWLREQAAAIAPETPIVLGCHHPLLLGGMIPLAGAPEILALFEQHNLKAVLGGHIHTNQAHARNGILHVTNACCASTRGNMDKDPRRGYRVLRCKDGEITTEFVTVREIPEE
ncbi:MAG: hypothetical protein GX131_02950 [candidate division WS1 bacterium]|nr:hypothetical protein [candidate division WS1 bacterium]